MNSNSWDDSENWSSSNSTLQNDKNSNTFLKKKRMQDQDFSFKKPFNPEESRNNSRPDDENPESNELFVRGLPYSADEDQVKEVFSKLGKVRFAKILKKEDGSSKGIGFVRFFSTEDAKNVLNESENIKIEGRSVKLSFSKGKGASPSGSMPSKPSNRECGLSLPERSHDTATKLFVSNLSFKAQEGDIISLFSKYGQLTELRLPLNEEGKRKGFCFIGFSSVESGEKALSANGQDLKGRNIRVEISNDRGGPRGGSDRGERNFNRGEDRSERSDNRGDRGGRGNRGTRGRGGFRGRGN